MNRQTIIIAIVAAAIFLLAGVGAVIYGISQGGHIPGLGQAPTPTPTNVFEIPDIKVTPPTTLTELAEQIRADYPELADMLENPELGSVYKDFYLAYKNGGQETAIALARQRGILNDQDQVVMTLVLDTEDSAPLISELEAEGVIVQGSYKTKINILIPVALIEEQIKAEKPDLILQRISNLDHVIRLEVPNKATTKQQGLIEGQGVHVTEADKWQATGLTGRGVKIGILDLGFGGYEDLLGRELPENVTLKAFGDTSALNEDVHGTACAEIVHEMAPDAEIVLAYYDGSDVAMGQAVDWLISQGVNIISNSTGSDGLTPMDGSGLAADMVNQAHDAGIFWANAAGNEADVHWRGKFTDSNGDTIHEFAPKKDVFPFIPFGPGVETQIILSWDDWQKVDQDYDLALLDKDGNLLGKSEEAQDGQPGELPAEGFLYEFEDSEIYLLAIQNYKSQARGDATFDLFIHGGIINPDLAVPERSLSSPSDARGAFVVGAVNWADDVLEPYSSQGPTADGRIKPDLAAPSVVDSASYAPEAFNGTSAATPHVAGAAALVLQAFPNSSPDDIATFLQMHSIDLGPAGPDDAFGAGRLDLGDPPAGVEPAQTPVTAAEPTETPASVAVEPTSAATEETSAEVTEEPPTEATEETATEVAELQATSTPRPPLEVGLPGQTGLPPQTPAEAPEASSNLSLIIGVGLCLVCLGGLLFVVLLVAGIVFMRRKK